MRVAGRPSTDLWPTVSVVVPTRYRPELLRRAVTSILDQRYPGRIECLVVFDQSPVRDPESFAPDARRGPSLSLVAIANDRTPGLAGARNAGVRAASGELVAFCDDDDEWLPKKLRTQVERLRAEPSADVVTCGISVHYEGRVRKRVPPGDRLFLADLLRDRHAEVHPSTVVARREAFLGRVGAVDEALPGSYAEDYEWLLRAARVAPILAVPEALVRVHWHRASYFEGRWSTIADALSYLIDLYPEFQTQPEGLARVSGQIAFAYAAAGRRRDSGRWARAALRLNRRERRAYLALLVGAGLLRADPVVRVAHLAGRGI